MMRIVVLGQPGAFGNAWSPCAASRLAQRLDLPCISASDAAAEPCAEPGWVATAMVGAFSATILRAADTAIWLHYSPLAVARAWVRGIRARLGRSTHPVQCPRLADLLDSFRHMAWTPHLDRLLRHPTLMHLQVFHLRNPDETDFWLRAQEHRLPPSRSPLAQPA